MKIIKNLNFNISEPALLALGTFDGLHRAHQLLLRYSRYACSKQNLKLCVFSFTNIPRNIFSESRTPSLMERKLKLSILRRYGTDYLIHIPFTEDFSRIEASSFMQILKQRIDLKFLCAGFNFRFGYRNTGDAHLLKREGEKSGFRVRIIPPVKQGEEIVSSTLVRDRIASGKMLEANRLLGHPFMFKANVISGRKRGRKLGFPTANLEPIDKNIIIPRNGVYFCYAMLYPKTLLPALLSIGTNPTFEQDGKVRLELFIPNFSGNLYSRKIIVIPLYYHRNEIRTTPEKLKLTMQNDLEASIEFFSGRKHENITGYIHYY